MKTILVEPTADLSSAAFVLVNGEPWQIAYACAPTAQTGADDVILEAFGADGEIVVTFADLERTADLPQGELRLKSGAVLSFVTPVTVH